MDEMPQMKKKKNIRTDWAPLIQIRYSVSSPMGAMKHLPFGCACCTASMIAALATDLGIGAAGPLVH